MVEIQIFSAIFIGLVDTTVCLDNDENSIGIVMAYLNITCEVL